MSCATAPVPIAAISGVTDVGTGWGQACAITSGDIVCWGDNSGGELGDDSDTGPQQCDLGPDPNNPGSDVYASCSTSPVLVDGFGAPLPPSPTPGSPSSSGGSSALNPPLGKLHTQRHTAHFTVSCSGGSRGNRCQVRLKITAVVTELRKMKKILFGHPVTLRFNVKKTIVVARKLLEIRTGHTDRI